MDLSEIKEKIQNIAAVLNDFSKQRDSTKTRKDYLEELGTLLSTYYGYSDFLIKKFLKMFSVNEVKKILEFLINK